jgi:hypothetical protein
MRDFCWRLVYAKAPNWKRSSVRAREDAEFQTSVRQTMGVLFSQQIETRTIAYAAWGFVALAFLAMLLIAPRNALKGRGSAKLPMRSLGEKPVLQIELARSEADLMQIFLVGNVEENLHDAAVGNNLDTFLFIPSYTGLLFMLCLLLSRFTRTSGHGPLLIAAVLLVPMIAICDWSENRGITRAIHHIEAQGSPEARDAIRISNPSLVKWTLTVLVLAVLGVEALYTNNWKWFPLAATLILLSSWIAFVLFAYARERWGLKLV